MNDTTSNSTQPPLPSVTHTVSDMENSLPSKGTEVPVPAAIEFMADIWEKEGTIESVNKAIEVGVYDRFSKDG